MPFPYYQRLNARQKAIYRKSDAVDKVPLHEPSVLKLLTRDLAKALDSGIQVEVGKAANRLCRGICADLGIEPVKVKVLLRRPSDAEGELQGLYEREEGKVARITVWMRTARHKRVVAFRTFLRTLLHEMCHHLDYGLLQLLDTLHTEGFFRRESHLADQLFPREPAIPDPEPSQRERKKKDRESRRKNGQISLPFGNGTK
jgi:hypothetical protein